ncbi:MAG: DUF2520 domain-containing protein [Cytophagales bacterium]|nr:DUF2520 domain-containing protein [Cytophagales bacterium]
MNSYKTVSIIGSGNLAFHLSKAIINSTTYKLQGIFGRTEARVKRLADQVGCEFDMLDEPYQFASDLVILCVSDDAIKEVLDVNQFPEETLVIHIAGSVPLSIFEAHDVQNGGVFYPLQTFSKTREIDFSDVPIFIEAQQLESLQELQALAFDIGGTYRELDSDKRLQLHLAAVFASNFTNSLMVGAESLLKDIGLEFRVLYPLLIEVVEKSARIGPVAAQTGPAKRSDLETLKKHEESLKNEEMRQLYRLMSDLIRRQSNE